ncbi:MULTISPECIES: Fur family transcriptional regulator [Geomicrobium]|uniref:Fur family zinc uptake transcriptional regulator n=1 Tax=Geomicrobium sediminis TaxID=1347788 RepID=A0ABS2PE75_9BACL|nr:MULTISPECIES: Fur family transcriptional regulator [Geomicrobium]MBM7633729.1 Fur family zinc uptake transcriptional regulator [Geomicrobium sediminis]GAJ99132.1 zinc uptake regulation protein Zur [Geomicrobium sp. JCM 19055]GAK06464.1 zinc uptake regulation protein Zur [Geomicrobium sp. JCM 19038]
MNVTKAIHSLKSSGYKYTDKRKDIIEFLSERDGYTPAKEVLVFMQEKYNGLSFDTVYRNLSLFAEIGILEASEWEGEKRFRLSCIGSHHHHMICLTCGKTKHIDACPMEQMRLSQDDFSVTSHKFEVFGYCKTCQ